MTRMWGLDPGVLCKDHLLGEHREMHTIVGIIENHQYGEAVVRGHTGDNQLRTDLINQRHNQLVEEFVVRGYDHDSPMDYRDELQLGELNYQRNLIRLRNCSDCLIQL